MRPTGYGRFVSAAFLSVWLTGWALGETFVLGILGLGAWSLLTGQPPGTGRAPLHWEAALPTGLFLLLWLALWTLGGWAAGRELLRIIFGRDAIRAGADALEVEKSYGLFRSRRQVARDAIRGFHYKANRAALCVETTQGVIELTRLGTPGNRAELLEALTTHFHLPAHPAASGVLPKNWCEINSLERDPVLVKNPVTRRKQALTMWVVFALIASVALYVLARAAPQPKLWALAVILTAFMLLSAWGAVWLSLGRIEWRLENGRVIRQRRFGSNRTTQFEAVGLELVEDNSGDGGPSYLLVAVAANAPARTYRSYVGKQRRIIHSQSDDATEPRNFGLWLQQRCQLTFTDLTTTEARQRDFEALKQQLANSGRLGQATLRLIGGLMAVRRPPDAHN